jgi:hypothetical protein
LIWIYPSAGPWHTAATILKRHHISARMTTEPDEAGTYRMLVFYTQAHDARDLLHLPLRFSPSRAA